MKQESPSERPADNVIQRRIVFGDIHGDLDTLARSLADRRLIRYREDLEQLVGPLRADLHKPFSPDLEALIIPQRRPTQLVLIGDLLDRFPYGYHILQFLSKVRWDRFNIHLVPLLGNHDLMNFMFFTNPFEVHQLMSEAGRPKEEIMQYIGSMGLADSLHSFYDLHHEELQTLQKQFYADGHITFRDGPLERTLRYPVDLAKLIDAPALRLAPTRRRWQPEVDPVFRAEDLAAYASNLVEWLGADGLPEDAPSLPTTLNALVQLVFDLLGARMRAHGERNWWRVFLREADRWFGYSPEINGFNAFVTESPDGTYQLLPIDWRLVAIVWRQHYGAFFRRTRILYLDGTTLYAHGGLSPLALLDPLFFGALYSPSADGFRDLKSLSQVNLASFVDRTNRLAAQVMENALNDYSFARMTGAELLDQMGSWRGSSEGLPEFGGPLWADFEFLKAHVEDPNYPRIRDMYRGFAAATGIERVVCGHTVFISWDDPERRFQKIEALEPLGIEYICVDNGCSRAYRWHEPVPTGIEFDANGSITLEVPDFEEGSHQEDAAPASHEAPNRDRHVAGTGDPTAQGDSPAPGEAAPRGEEERDGPA